ncbi:tetratricopeptide repeat protein [Moritella sp. 24]|nr:tetratricopeptide repeat protein [Moritella sp. 24]
MRSKYKVNNMIKWILITVVLLSGCSTTTNGQAELPSLADIPPESRATLLDNAYKAEQNQKFDKAIVFYVKALEQEYDDSTEEKNKLSNTQIFYNIGVLEIKQGHSELALTAFKHLLQYEPNHVLAQTQLGILYLEKKLKKQATDLLTKAITTDQLRLGNNINDDYVFTSLDTMSPLSAYIAFSVIQDLEGHHAKAIETLNLVQPLAEQDPYVYTNIGYSNYLSGNLVEAEVNYRKAIDIDPEFRRAWLNLGLVYTRKGMYTKALQTLKQVMPIEHAYNDIGYFLMLDGRYSEAEYFLEQAIDLSPRYFVKANVNLENVKLELSQNINMVSSDNKLKQ